MTTDAYERLRDAGRKIGELLELLAQKRSCGSISEACFVEMLLRVEEEQVRPAGFVLTASNTLDDWTNMTLRARGASDPCTSFEFLPASGEFRPPGSGPG